MQRGAVGQHQCGAGVHVHAVGQGHELQGRHHRLLGEGPVAAEADDPLTGLNMAHALAHRLHHAGQLRPGRERQRRLDLIQALHDQRIGKVHRRRLDPDAHLAGARLGHRHVTHLQLIDRTVGIADQGAHGQGSGGRQGLKSAGRPSAGLTPRRQARPAPPAPATSPAPPPPARPAGAPRCAPAPAAPAPPATAAGTRPRRTRRWSGRPGSR